jgi:formyl-CoA transferase/CoA:oxalate CoA-transferase
LLPYQTFRTKTRDLALGVGNEKLWRTFCPLIGRTDLASDPRYATNAARVVNRETLIETLQEVFMTKPYEEWEAILLGGGVPVGAINTIDRVVEHPQVVGRGAFVDCEHPVAGKVRVVGPPARLSDTPADVRLPAPLLGEHTDRVLRARLGLDDREISRLRSVAAIG